jgi:hypothetical protein
MAGMGQNPNLPRRSIAVRFTLNKQTPTGGVQYYVQILLQKSFCTGNQKFFWP